MGAETGRRADQLIADLIHRGQPRAEGGPKPRRAYLVELSEAQWRRGLARLALYEAESICGGDGNGSMHSFELFPNPSNRRPSPGRRLLKEV